MKEPRRISRMTEVMLCWKPGTGDVRLVRWPDPDRISAGLQSAFACYRFVHEMTHEQRKTHAFVTAMHLIVRDGCDPAAVHEALLCVEEYRDGCSDDMPGIL
jgi:hypothetical protein